MEAQTQGQSSAAPEVTAASSPAAVTPEVTAPIETPVTEEKPPEIDFSSKFAALTRKERAVLEKEKQIKAREASLREDPLWKEYETFRSVKSDPRQHGIKGLELLGLSYKDITDIVLNDGKVPVEKQVEELRQELTRRDEAEKTAIRDRAAQAEVKALESFKSQIKAHVDTQGDTYELLKANDAYDLVVEVSEQYWNRTGLIPDIKDVTDHVEKYLEEQGRKLLALKKFQPKVAAQATASLDPGVKLVTPKTLSNKDTAASAVGSSDSPMDPEKRMAWTAAKLKAAIAAKQK